jgi:hypothetical protein
MLVVIRPHRVYRHGEDVVDKVEGRLAANGMGGA